MKKLLAVFLAAIMVFSLAACGSKQDEGSAEPETQQAAPAEEETEAPETETEESEAPEAETQESEGAESTDNLVIGVTLHDLSSDGYSANMIGIKEKAESLGNVEIRAVSAEGSAEDQVRQVEDFITAGVDGIIILPVDSAALSNVVAKAVEAGIPVVSMDRSVEGDAATATIESDNYVHGQVAADLMLQAAEKQGLAAEDLKVLELLGDQASSSGLERHEGFADRCEELGITILSALPTNWNADEAYNSVLDAFQANDDINAIFEASDIAMHSGVSSALEQLSKYAPAGEEGHIIVTSVDGGPNGLACVKDGYIDAMAQQSLLVMGSDALDAVLSAAGGETIDPNIIRLSPVEVTVENADSDELWPNKIK